MVNYPLKGDIKNTVITGAVKKGVLKNFVNFTGKQVMECLFDKVAGLRPATLLTRDSNTGLFV